MLKKKFPEMDLHINSNIIIHMDEKARLKSHYQKKYTDSIQKVNINSVEMSPAGTKNFLRRDPQEQNAHLNVSRRRILNDFITRRPLENDLNALANRNRSDMLKDADNKSQETLRRFDYRGNQAHIGPSNRPGKFLQMQNRAMGHHGIGMKGMGPDSANMAYQQLPSVESYRHSSTMDNRVSSLGHGSPKMMPSKSTRDINQLQKLKEAQLVNAQLAENTRGSLHPSSVTRNARSSMNTNLMAGSGENANNKLFPDQRQQTYEHDNRADSLERNSDNEYNMRGVRRDITAQDLRVGSPLSGSHTRNQSFAENGQNDTADRRQSPAENGVYSSVRHHRGMINNNASSHNDLHQSPVGRIKNALNNLSKSPSSALDHAGSHIVKGNGDLATGPHDSQQLPFTANI